VARTLGVRLEGDASALEALKEHLREKHVLLILDNFEQVVDAAALATELLASSRLLKILVTSRAVLRVSGEREYPVPPLAQPDYRGRLSPEEAGRYPAVELFVQRAQAVQPEFRLTRENAALSAEICARLDGLPLAIELAAARVKMLPPESMLARLDNRLKLLTRGARDLPDRQQTLRSAIGWGFDLLSEEEKTVFRRLCVFSGGFTLPMAQSVCDPGGEMDLELLDALASLVDKSFLRHEQPEGRFTLFGTIREFGLEELEASGERELMQRSHARGMVDLAREAEGALRGPEQQAWLDRLEREHENIRVALRWAAEAEGGSEIAWELAGSLWRFWFLRGCMEEGRRVLEELIRRGAPGSTAARARAVTGAAFLAFFRGDTPTAERHFQESMRLSDEAGDLWHLAISLCGLGVTAQYRQAHDRARVALQRGANLARKLRDPWLIGLALSSQWTSVVHAGEFAASEPLFTECLEQCRAAGDPSLTCWPLMILGVIHHVTGRLETAEDYLRQAMVMAHTVGNVSSVASSMEAIAEIWITRGRTEEGARLLGAAEALDETTGAARQQYGLPMYRQALAALRERLGEEAATRELAAGRRLSLEEALALAQSA
jgi:predicted ATPase